MCTFNRELQDLSNARYTEVRIYSFLHKNEYSYMLGLVNIVSHTAITTETILTLIFCGNDEFFLAFQQTGVILSLRNCVHNGSAVNGSFLFA